MVLSVLIHNHHTHLTHLRGLGVLGLWGLGPWPLSLRECRALSVPICLGGVKDSFSVSQSAILCLTVAMSMSIYVCVPLSMSGQNFVLERSVLSAGMSLPRYVYVMVFSMGCLIFLHDCFGPSPRLGGDNVARRLQFVGFAIISTAIPYPMDFWEMVENICLLRRLLKR